MRAGRAGASPEVAFCLFGIAPCREQGGGSGGGSPRVVLACVVWGAGRHSGSGVCGPCWWAKQAQNLSQATPSSVHEGGDILNELCSPPPPFRSSSCLFAATLAVPRPAEAPMRR